MNTKHTKIKILRWMTVTILLGVLSSTSFPYDFSNLSSIEPQRLGEKEVLSVALSPDGQTLASVHNQGTPGPTGTLIARTIYLWDVRSGTKMGAIESDLDMGFVVFSPDGKTLASTHALNIPDGRLSLWDVAEQTRIGMIQSPSNISEFVFSPDGNLIATSGRRDDLVRIWDVQTQSQVGELPKGEGINERSLIFSPNGSLLLVGGRDDDSAIRIWEIASLSQADELIGLSDTTTDLSFSPDGRLLAAISHTNGIKSVYLWDFESRELVGALGSHQSPIGPMAFSPDGKFLAYIVYWDTNIHLWDVERQEEVGVLTGHDAVYSYTGGLVFSPDGKWLIGGSSNGVELWKFEPDVDFNDDGAVDLDDLSRLIESWGMNDPLVDIGPMPFGDGIVDSKDLLVLAEHMVEYSDSIETIQ